MTFSESGDKKFEVLALVVMKLSQTMKLLLVVKMKKLSPVMTKPMLLTLTMST